MEKLPVAWVERIFERLQCVYKENWIVDERRKHLLLTQWCTGLSGLTGPEIQKAIAMCECSDRTMPPTVIEFYHYAKGIRVLPRRKLTGLESIGSKEVGKKFLQEIRAKL